MDWRFDERISFRDRFYRTLGECAKTFQLYQEFHLPSPIWDRDYVLAGEWSVDFDGDHVRKAVLHLQSITREDCPVRDDRVRAALNLQLYTLTPTLVDQLRRLT